MTPMFTLLSILLPSALAAEPYNAHGFRLVPSDGDLHDPLAMWRPELQIPRSFGLTVLAEYAKEPLVRYHYTDNGLAETPVIDNLFGLNIGGAYALNRRVALTLSMPVWANVEAADGENYAALGDIRFAAPIGLVMPMNMDGENEPLDSFGFRLSLVPFVNLPSGNEDLFLGSGGFGGGGLLAAGIGGERMQVYANAGVEMTPKVTELANLNGGTFIKGNLGTSYAFTDTFAVRAEAALNAALTPNDVAYTEAPAEAILSLRYRNRGALSFTAGGATALTPGAGAARYRAFAGAGWTFGKPDEVVAPPVALAPCELNVLVQDSAGKPINNAQVTADNRVVTTGGNGQAGFEDCTLGMSQPITVMAQDYMNGSSPGFELQRGPNERVIVLQEKNARLKVIVLDEKGAPHDSRIRFLEGPTNQPVTQIGPDGEETIVLMPGDWSVLVSSPTHVPQEAKVSLDPGEFETLTFRFTADKPLPVCEETVVLHDINFDFDIDTPMAESLPILKNVAVSLKDCPDVYVEIGGHTDSKGSDDYNLSLSERRMNSVKQILIGYGINEKRMTAKGFGEAKPMATNNTDEGRALNRRVEFVPQLSPQEAKDLQKAEDKEKKAEDKAVEKAGEKAGEKAEDKAKKAPPSP